MPEVKEKGGISVERNNIFPVIKRWLYSEKEIFLREIVSNASDAVTKLKRLSSLGKAEDFDGYRINVTIDKENSTLTVSDNGIGMSEDEVKKYICQVALSGALEFIEKYEGESEGAGNGIIGHFGLGFYSAFMVSDTVELITRSFDGSPSCRWVCTSDGEYEIFDGEREERGTDVIMHITEEESEFLEEARIKGILKKYCSFLPVPVYLNISESDKEAEQINNTNPLWQKTPSECTDEEYKSFYNEVFGDFREPLFHIHLNADYPLNFKGILYFPKINANTDSLEGQVKLYYNQVFVADNIKEVIPEYMLMLKGVLDCPELPLNVSRSYLQNNTYVSKLSAHIVKKAADKFNSMFATDREAFEKIWGDCKVFFEYASLRDSKFNERVKNSYLLKCTDGKFRTLSEYLEEAKETNENIVYYCTDEAAQAQYISMLTSGGVNVVVFDHILDIQYAGLCEKDNVKFMCVDSDISSSVKEEAEEYNDDSLVSAFKEICPEGTEIKFEALKNESIPALLTSKEEERRMADMMRMYGMGVPDKEKMTLSINSNSKLIRSLSDKDSETVKAMAKEIYFLSLLGKRSLDKDELNTLLYHSYSILEKAVGDK